MLTLGALIWISVRPLIRLVLCALFGFAITKADIFPLVASSGAGQIMLNITLPCLMFSKIVPAFTPQNISVLGPLVTVALIYESLGLLTAWLVKRFCWVPHRFRYGIICAGAFGNYSDVPTAVIMSITGSLPFDASTDQNLSVAYIAAFVLVFFLTLFPFGGHRLVEMDYVGPDVEDEDLRISMSAKTRQNIRCITQLSKRMLCIRCKAVPTSDSDPQAVADIEKCESTRAYISGANVEACLNEVDEAHFSNFFHRRIGGESKQVSFLPDETTVVPTEVNPSQACSRIVSRVASPVPSEFRSVYPTFPSTPVEPASKYETPALSSARDRSSFKHKATAYLRSAGRSLLMPPSLAILSAIPISVITHLKALFTPVPNSRIPNAPDGQPPLAFILDTASFVGAASIPIGLICLGSALARLKVPRGAWNTLPLGAISWLAFGKMIVMPILGVLIVDGFVSVGFIDGKDKVLRFVCIFFSCVPTATSQVFLTQVYSGTGSAGPLPAFLVPQYFIMFFSMTILTAYTLSTLY